MLTSAEVRWFFEGPIPADIEKWFGREGLTHHAAPREDHYLVFPAALGLGLKLREGRLEVKPLIKVLGVRNFAADATGNVQVWEKWSDGDAAVMEFERLRASCPDLWVTVVKERTLRKFSPGCDSLGEVDAGTVFLSEGCNAELTKITMNGETHWSFAFEAFGDPSRAEDHVSRVAARVFSEAHRPHHPFSANNSHSYPEWLERFAK